MSILKDLASLAAVAAFCTALCLVGGGLASTQAERAVIRLAGEAR